ncbi:DUF692 domain-containing protein [Streptomyces sp. OZ13]|uniref:DUF692 domain-containing protein n=1 Tax=Streptomyces sp. OZ13 TaxID=3452210 RepID=UPI003F88885A
MELGIGIGWRPEISDTVERLPDLDWVEVVAENVCPGHLPPALLRLRSRGVRVVPHGVSLGLGGADRPSERRLADLAERAEALDAPLVTEHVAFVRAGGALTASSVLEAGHLLPVPRTWDALAVLCENVRIAQDSLPVPLALENIAAMFSWPDEELTEGQFLAELVERTGVRLLIDVANLHTNHVNRGEDPSAALDELPVESIAYVHVAGGVERDGIWHDTHAHPVTQPVLDILSGLRARVNPPGVLLERDDDFPASSELERELATIRATLEAAGGPGAPGRCAAPRVPAGAGGRGGAGTPAAGLFPSPPLPEPGAPPLPGGVGGPPPDPRASNSPYGLAAVGGAPSGADFAERNPARPALEGTARSAVRGPGLAPVSGRGGEGNGSAQRSHPHGPNAATATATTTATSVAATPTAGPPPARQRVALTQAALLSALVAGTPAPEGFDARRLRVQSRALAAKRADVVAKIAPELREILGTDYRSAFLAYAKDRPMHAGYRRDALDFAEHLLASRRPQDSAARRRLSLWWQERSAPRPPRGATRLVRVARAALAAR